MIENKMTQRTIEITHDKYDELLQDHVVLMMLCNTLFNSMGLSYDGKTMRIKDDEQVIGILNGAFPTRLDAVRRYLQEEEQKRTKEHIDVLKDEIKELDAEQKEANNGNI